MEQDINQKIDLLKQKVDNIYISTEKTRKYFMWTMIITIVLFILPLIGLAFALPSFMSSYVGNIQSLQ